MSNRTKKYYEVVFFLLALITVTLAIIDITDRIPVNFYSEYLIIDNLILLIFAGDYFYRFFSTSGKKSVFIKNNIFDLLAILPFSSLLRGFRLFRLLRILKVFRATVFIGRLTSRFNRFLRTNGFIYVLYITLTTIVIGSILIYIFEKNLTIYSYADAIWWSFVTTTTVGYGDISPSSNAGRIVAALLMMIGIGFVGMLTGTIATYFLSSNKNKTISENQILDLSDISKDKFEAIVNYVDFIKSK